MEKNPDFSRIPPVALKGGRGGPHSHCTKFYREKRERYEQKLRGGDP